MAKKTTTKFEDEEYNYIESDRARNRGVRFKWDLEQAILHVAKERRLSGGFSEAVRLILIGEVPDVIEQGLVCKEHLIYRHKECLAPKPRKAPTRAKV